MIALTLSGNSARSCLPVARPLPALAAASSVGCHGGGGGGPSFAVEVCRRPPSVVAARVARPPHSVAVCRTDTNTRKARTDRSTATSRDTRDKKSGRNTVPRRGRASRPRRARRGAPWRRRRETCDDDCGEYLLELETKSPLFM